MEFRSKNVLSACNDSTFINGNRIIIETQIVKIVKIQTLDNSCMYLQSTFYVEWKFKPGMKQIISVYLAGSNMKIIS